MKDIKERIRGFIIENFLFGEDAALKDNTSFLNDGIIDSTGVLELIEYLEDEFKIKINDEDMVPENLDSLDNLEKYITKILADS